MKEINEAVLSKFYSAFQRMDYKEMQSLYHDDCSFSDPVFQNLNSKQARSMWEMLLTSSKNLRIEFRNIITTGNTGKCHWEAWYTFSKTGKAVHNIIDASFEFKDGKIFRHVDKFDLWRWSRQALGFPGLLLGWSPVLRNKVRKTAMERLSKFSSGHSL